MGHFTAWVEEAYPDVPFPPLHEGGGLSMGNARALAWASQLAYEIEDRPKVERILSRWGWSLVEPVVVGFMRPVSADVVGGYVARAGTSTIIAFGGTEPERLQAWLRDFDLAPTADGVHGGFAEAVTSILPQLHRVEGEAPGLVFLAGHSLGVAMAAIAAYRLSQSGPAVAAKIHSVGTCGMPRAATAPFAALYESVSVAGGRSLGEQTLRLVHGHDIVPHVPPSLPPFGFRHVGRSLVAPHAGRFDPSLLASAAIDPAPRLDPAVFGQVLAGLSFGAGAGLPPFPAAHSGVADAVRMLPSAIRDHLMDRYIHALPPS